MHSLASLAKASVVSPGIGSAYFGKYFTPYGELKHSCVKGRERKRERRIEKGDREIERGKKREEGIRPLLVHNNIIGLKVHCKEMTKLI